MDHLYKTIEQIGQPDASLKRSLIPDFSRLNKYMEIT